MQTWNEAPQSKMLAGYLNRKSSQTRLDLSCQACDVSTSVKNATINDLKKRNKSKQKLKSSKYLLLH